MFLHLNKSVVQPRQKKPSIPPKMPELVSAIRYHMIYSLETGPCCLTAASRTPVCNLSAQVEQQDGLMCKRIDTQQAEEFF